MNETVLTLADSIADLEGTARPTEKVLTLADSEADLAGVARPDSDAIQKKLNLATQLAELNSEIAAGLKAERDELQSQLGDYTVMMNDKCDALQAQVEAYAGVDTRNLELIAENQELQLQVEALKLDAARYRALRDSGHLPPDEFTKQVDAAIKGSEA
jgi:hypothetical protein